MVVVVVVVVGWGLRGGGGVSLLHPLPFVDVTGKIGEWFAVGTGTCGVLFFCFGESCFSSRI